MTTEERLERLEKKYRRLLLGGGGLVALLLGAMVVGAAFQDKGQAHEDLRTKKITFVANDGKPVLVVEAEAFKEYWRPPTEKSTGKGALYLVPVPGQGLGFPNGLFVMPNHKDCRKYRKNCFCH